MKRDRLEDIGRIYEISKFLLKDLHTLEDSFESLCKDLIESKMDQAEEIARTLQQILELAIEVQEIAIGQDDLNKEDD